MIGIYSITHMRTGRTYIGSSRCMSARWARHRRLLRQGIHQNPKLQAVWSKYGEPEFIFALVEVVDDPTQLKVREQAWLDDMNPELNIDTNALRPFCGRKHTPESVQKMRVAQVGRKHSVDTLARMSETRRAYWASNPVSEEERQRRRDRQAGRAASEETRARISASLIGNRNSVGRVDWVGRKHTAETTEMLRAKAQAEWAARDPKEVTRIRQLMAAAKRGKPLSAAHRAAISAGLHGNTNGHGGLGMRKRSPATGGAIDRIEQLRRSPLNLDLAKAIIADKAGDPILEAAR